MQTLEFDPVAGGNAGFRNLPGAQAQFNNPIGVDAGPDGTLYVADYDNHAIRVISPDGKTFTLAGGDSSGNKDGTGALARFSRPIGISVSHDGKSVFVADQNNHSIRRVTLEDKEVTTWAGDGKKGNYNSDSGYVRFSSPMDVACDANGCVFVADGQNHSIRKIDADGHVTTIATVHNPGGLAALRDGSVAVTARSGQIFLVKPSTKDEETVYSVVALAGMEHEGYRDGAGDVAWFHNPRGIVEGPDGELYVADVNNHCIRRITRTPSVKVCTVAGQPGGRETDTAAVQGGGNTTHFHTPAAVCICLGTDSYSLILTDGGDHRIYRAKLLALPPVLPSTLVDDMRRLFTSGQGADFTLHCEGEAIPVHSHILSVRSEPFANMFSRTWEETESKAAQIEQTSSRALHALIEYMYTDELTFEDDVVLPVLFLANRYGIERVENFCVSRCFAEVTTDNALEWLMQSDEHGHAQADLGEFLKSYVARHWATLREKQPEQVERLGGYPALAVEILQRVMI